MPGAGAWVSKGHNKLDTVADGQKEPGWQITGTVMPVVGQNDPGWHAFNSPFTQKLPWGHTLHCHPPRGAEALITINVPLLQVQFWFGENVALAGHAHWAIDSDLCSEYSEGGQNLESLVFPPWQYESFLQTVQVVNVATSPKNPGEHTQSSLEKEPISV